MRVFVPVLIFLILVVGALVALRMTRTANRRREEWRALENRATLAEGTLSQIGNELSLAQSANMSLDTLIIDSIMREYDHKKSNPNAKELSK